MASFWDFLGGASGYLLDERNKEREEQRLMTRNQQLEKLRRETSDYEYNRNRADALKTVDVRQSYVDPTTKEYVMVNSQGSVIGRRAATSSELREDQLSELDLKKKQADLEYKQEQIRRSRATTIDMGGGGGGGRRGLDSREAKQEDMASLVASMTKNLREYGLPDSYVLAFEAKARQKIQEGTASASWLRSLESFYLRRPEVQGAVGVNSSRQAAESIFGPPPKKP